MGFFKLFEKNKANDYDWAIGRKGLSMIAGIGVVSKEVLEASTKDPVIEGKKRGYKRAAEEFEAAYAELSKEYEEAKNLFKEQLTQKDKQLNEYIAILEKLEKQKSILEEELHHRKKLLNVGVSSGSGVFYVDILDMLKSNPKFDKAKIDGYCEAKEMYTKKLTQLKGKLNKLKTESDCAINAHQELITSTLHEITNLRMTIAEMKLIK